MHASAKRYVSSYEMLLSRNSSLGSCWNLARGLPGTQFLQKLVDIWSSCSEFRLAKPVFDDLQRCVSRVLHFANAFAEVGENICAFYHMYLCTWRHMLEVPHVTFQQLSPLHYCPHFHYYFPWFL